MPKTAIKRLTAIIILVTLLLSIFSLDVFAYEQEQGVTLSLETRLATASNVRVNSDAALEESINTQLKNFEKNVNIYEFKLCNNEQNLQKIVDILSGALPECFHISEEFSISDNGEYIIEIQPTYIYTKDEYNSMLAECEAAADKLLEGVEGNSALGEREKLLILHDRIALSCEYDYENLLNNSVPEVSHRMYGALVNKVAVCQGYTLAYSYLLDRIGIKNYYCSSENLNHAWNIVYLDGKSYHVDITYDDPVWDVTGQVLHTNFLVSTDALRQNNHNAYDYDSSPSDTTYDNYFWQDINSAFVYLNGEIYYTELETSDYIAIKRYSDKQTIYKTKYLWFLGEGSYYSGNYAKLAVCGSKILFSLGDGIYSLDPNTKEAQKIYSNPEVSNYNNIYGFTYADGQLVFDISNTPLFDANTKKNNEYKVEYHDPGNINNDSNIDLADITVLAKILAGWNDLEFNPNALDVDGNGVENLCDLVRLAQYLAGWDVELAQ